MISFLKKIIKKNYIIYSITNFIYQKFLVSFFSKVKNLNTFIIKYKKNKEFILKPKEASKMTLYEKNFFFPKYSFVYKDLLKNLEEKKTLDKEYDLISKEFFKEKIECVIDIGANIGFQTLFYNKFFSNKTKIYCFEPHPLSFYFLEKNLSIYDNIILNNFALGSEDKYDFMSIPYHEVQKLSDLGVMSIGQHSNYFKTEILIKKFDQLGLILNNYKSIYVKIDVEGYEGNVLEGMTIFLKNDLNIYLKIEISKHFNNVKKIKSTIEILGRCSYDFYIIKNQKFVKMNESEIIMFLTYKNADIFCKKIS